jgi:hypothetical protein
MRHPRICAVTASAAVAAIGFALPAAASAAITAEPDALEVAKAIIHDQATLVPAATGWEAYAVEDTSDPDAPLPSGVADSALSGFPTSQSTFGLLSSGDVRITDTPNDGESEGEGLTGADPTDPQPGTDNGGAFGNTDNDVTILRIGVNVPAGADCLSLDYRFLSDEFPEFVGTEYNDAFIAQVDRVDWTTQESTIVKPGDFATNTGGEPVSVNGVGPVAVSEAEAAGTTFDAATGRVNTKTAITPGPHSIYLSIFDQGDEIYDSVIMLDRLAFIAEGAATCKPPEVPVVVPPPPPPPPPPAATPPPPPPPPSNVFTVGSSITFGANGTATMTVTVPGPGVLTAADGTGVKSTSARIAARRKPLIARTRVRATKAGPVKVRIRPSTAGKKVLRRKGRLKVKVALTFTPDGGSPKTTVRTVTLKLKKRRR